MSGADGFTEAAAVADAVLYEGYLLYPYRRSSQKNRVRFQFGVLMPKSCFAGADPEPTVAGSAESWYQETQTLVEPGRGSSTVTVRARFLQLQRRTVERTGPSGWQETDRIDAGGESYLPFDEAVAQHVDLTVHWPDPAVPAAAGTKVLIPGGETREAVPGGRVVRRRDPLTVHVVASIELADAPFRLARLRLRVENATEWRDDEAPRERRLMRSLLATHSMATIDEGHFLSLLDPPVWAAAAAAECRNHHTFPVLAGNGQRKDLLLSSPIILYDHPEIAPESPGELFDATEIDEILSLRALALTDAEKIEARATDARSAAIVDRVDAMEPEIWGRLHGAIRSLRPIRSDAGGDDTAVVRGAALRPGSAVRLRPRRHGTDAQDMFVSGKTGKVESVLTDVDGSRFVAVTLDDDPRAHIEGGPGRLRHFSLDEVEPLDSLDSVEPIDGVEPVGAWEPPP